MCKQALQMFEHQSESKVAYLTGLATVPVDAKSIFSFSSHLATFINNRSMCEHKLYSQFARRHHRIAFKRTKTQNFHHPTDHKIHKNSASPCVCFIVARELCSH